MSDRELTLIVVGQETAERTRGDRGGGELQSRGPLLGKFFAKKGTVEISRVKGQLDSTLAQTRDLLESVENQTFGEWGLNEITVGLAITAEGTIGVATAGVEASIELKFLRSAAKPGES
jgi:hypothetical protein